MYEDFGPPSHVVFCKGCGLWVNNNTPHECPGQRERDIRAARKRLEDFLGDCTIYQ